MLQPNDVSIGFIMGPSGAGKGCGVADVLESSFGVTVFSTGKWSREFRSAHANDGTLVDDDHILNAVSEDFHEHVRKRCKLGSYMIDAPRSPRQFLGLIDMFQTECPLVRVVTLDVRTSREICEFNLADRAIREGRPDDARPEIVHRRLEAYFGQGGIDELVTRYGETLTWYREIDGDVGLKAVRKNVFENIAPEFFGEAIQELANVPD